MLYTAEQDQDREQMTEPEQIHLTQTTATGTGPHNRTRENPKHLTGTTRQLVSRQLEQQQEPGNPERKTETGTGAGQKKQLSALGDSFVCKCVTQ